MPVRVGRQTRPRRPRSSHYRGARAGPSTRHHRRREGQMRADRWNVPACSVPIPLPSPSPPPTHLSFPIQRFYFLLSSALPFPTLVFCSLCLCVCVCLCWCEAFKNDRDPFCERQTLVMAVVVDGEWCVGPGRVLTGFFFSPRFTAVERTGRLWVTSLLRTRRLIWIQKPMKRRATPKKEWRLLVARWDARGTHLSMEPNGFSSFSFLFLKHIFSLSASSFCCYSFLE